ncbi:caveolae-associated protein 1-like [Conger conger]|uniref:caveolae-associated protein 1-like n=1 Tax=Conger conger TaxID=82655 RepID=UPI002A5A7033|nr:caveolae-associated protein 1-like [Conger conger]
MADSSAQLDRVPLTEASDDDDEVALAAPGPAGRRGEEEDEDEAADGPKSEAQMNGVMVLALLDKIIGVVDQIQQTQNGLEARQDDMERSVSGIHSDLTKLTKNYGSTASSVNKMLDKVRKVSVNIKTVRSDLEKQAGQIKQLENNEHELLKRRNFKVLIYPEAGKLAKADVPAVEGEAVLTEGAAEQVGDEARMVPSSDEEVEIEEIIEESRAERIKRTGRQQIDNIKKAFSKEKMERTRQKTRENLAKTRQRTRENMAKTRLKTKENMEKTRQNLGKTMEQLGNRITIKPERKEKPESTSKKKAKKAKKPSDPNVYKVPPFTFHVKKYPEEVAEEAELETEEGEEEEVEVVQETVDLMPVEEALEEALVEVTEELTGPEKTLLKVAEDSELVLVELNHKKDGK